MASDWTDDEQLLADLGAALRAQRAVPDRLMEMGRAAFAWQHIDAELAALTFDSTVAEGAGVRAKPAALRALTFAAGGLTIELEVTADALVGQLVPAQPGEVDVLTREGATTVPADDVGWFTIRPRPAGMFRLHVRPTDGASVITEWTTL